MIRWCSISDQFLHICLIYYETCFIIYRLQFPLKRRIKEFCFSCISSKIWCQRVFNVPDDENRFQLLTHCNISPPFSSILLVFCRQGQNTMKNISTCLKKKRNRILSCIQVIIMFCVIYIYLRHVKLQVVYAITCVIYNDMQFGDGFLWNFCLFEFLN